MKLYKIAKSFFKDFFAKFFAAWFLASSVVLLSGNGVISLNNVNVVNFALAFVSSVAVIWAASSRFKDCVYGILVFAVLVFSLLLLMQSNDIYTFIATGIIFVLSTKYYFSKKNVLDVKFPKFSFPIILTAVILTFFAIITTVSVLRYLSYCAPNYDFGIFCNMFYNMKDSFRPLVSCERDQILSHFAVHFSPAMYIFLPVYFIFPSPVTIAVCQTAAIASGVIPFILTLKHKGISKINICFFSVVYMANAAYTAGCLYDFHENCLLPVFLMWMFYFYEKRKFPLVFLFAFLTFTVKEDAFIYVAVFAVYTIFAKKEIKTGFALAAFAVAYFAVATFILKTYGLGIMSDRFSSMIAGDEGLFGIIKTVLTNLGYSVKQIFSTAEETPKKFIYFLQIMCPLAFIPFFAKKPVNMILMLPIFLNLLTDYPYQYDISFQYGFGLMSLLLYLTVLNVEDMESSKRDFVCMTAAGLAAMMFFTLIIPKFSNTVQTYTNSQAIFEEMDDVLETIPKDAKIGASTFLIPHLSDRKELYEVYYTTQTDFDYLVFDMRDGYKEESLEIAAKYEAIGYKLYDCSSQYVFIYKK